MKPPLADRYVFNRSNTWSIINKLEAAYTDGAAVMTAAVSRIERWWYPLKDYQNANIEWDALSYYSRLYQYSDYTMIFALLIHV